MSEIALRTTEFLNHKAKYTAYRPVGSVVTAISAWRIKAKWTEIICDLMEPSKRKTYTGLPGYDKLIAAWTPALLGEWVSWYRKTQLKTINRPALDTFWTEQIEPIGVLADLPTDPTGEKPVYETWLWSEYERKRFFVVANTDLTDTQAEALNGFDEKPGTVGGIGKTFLTPKKMLDYKTSLGLDAATVAKIDNVDVVVDPKFDAPVASNVFEDIEARIT